MCRDPLWRLGPYLLGIWLIISWAATEGVRCYLNGRLETLFRPHCCEKRFHFCFVVGKHRREHEQNTSKKKKNRTQPDAVAGNMSECLSPCVPDSLAKREETEKKIPLMMVIAAQNVHQGWNLYWSTGHRPISWVFFFIWACLYTESVWTEITISNHCFIIIIIIVMVSLPFNSEENVNKWQLKFTF